MNFTDSEMEAYRLQVGDLLLGEASGSPKEVGKPALWRGEIADCAFQNTLIRVRPRGPDPEYLLHYFRHQALSGRFAAAARGVGIYHLGSDALARWRLPLPPLAEQQRIAEVLDQAGALRAKRLEARALLDDLALAIFMEMFGTGHEMHRWPTARLGERLDFLTSGSRGWAAHYADDGYLFLRIQNVVGGELDLGDVAFVRPPESAEAKRTKVEAGDVLLSITADLGRVAVVPENLPPAHINQHLSILRTRQVEPRFLAAFLGSPEGRRQLLARDRHGVKAGLNFDDIRSVEIPMPPRALQQEFAQRMATVAECRARMTSHAEELTNLQLSLQQRAFSGQL